MRECWNRQTGTFEVRVFRRVGSSPISRTIAVSPEFELMLEFRAFLPFALNRGVA